MIGSVEVAVKDCDDDDDDDAESEPDVDSNDDVSSCCSGCSGCCWCSELNRNGIEEWKLRIRIARAVVPSLYEQYRAKRRFSMARWRPAGVVA